MAITMVMPLMNTGQQADKNAIDQLVVHDNGDGSDTKSTQSGGGGTDGSTDDGSGNNTDGSENTAATQSSVLTRTTMMHSPPNSPSSASTAICRP